MKSLSENWMIEPLFDYEYKMYQVLSYTKGIESKFQEARLYPYLADVKRHLDLIDQFESNRNHLEESLRRELLKIDLRKLEMIRKDIPDNEGALSIINDILKFARKKLGEEYRLGLEQREDVEKQIYISPVGILNPDHTGGLLFLHQHKSLRIYTYRMRLIRRPVSENSHKDIHTMFLDEVNIGIIPDFNQIKWNYIRRSDSARELNTYLVETDGVIPRFETLLPLVKEKLLELAA